MTSPLMRSRWSPYAVGAAIGVLSWGTFLWMGKTLGASTTFVRAAAAVESTFAPEHVRTNAYYGKYLSAAPLVDWQFVLVVALALGAFLAALPGRRFQPRGVPALWAARFGPSRTKRALGAFVGGAVLLFGARMAGGCTSGHGISGGLQLALSSWTFVAAMLASGIVTARILYHGREA